MSSHPLPHLTFTPIPNLWNVGDGARPPLAAGISGCVESARLAVAAVNEYTAKA